MPLCFCWAEKYEVEWRAFLGPGPHLKDNRPSQGGESRYKSKGEFRQGHHRWNPFWTAVSVQRLFELSNLILILDSHLVCINPHGACLAWVLIRINHGKKKKKKKKRHTYTLGSLVVGLMIPSCHGANTISGARGIFLSLIWNTSPFDHGQTKITLHQIEGSGRRKKAALRTNIKVDAGNN